MSRLSRIPLSVLDLSPIVEGGTAADSFHNSLALAQHAERLGYNRFWLAEHHNMPGIASAATSVVIGHVAGGTSTIRVGAGGVMLPNHAPLVIAEQFGTIGDAETVKAGLNSILESTESDELMINSIIYDHAARLRSYEIVAGIWKERVQRASTTCGFSFSK